MAFTIKQRDAMVEAILRGIRDGLGHDAKAGDEQLVLASLATATGIWLGGFLFNEAIPVEAIAGFVSAFEGKLLQAAAETIHHYAEADS